MKAVILAGGLGTRLAEEPVLRPKPMVEIGVGVTAFPLASPTSPSLLEAAQADLGITSVHGDIRDYDTLNTTLRDSCDWAVHRLLPYVVRAFFAGHPLSLRMPGVIRPWQHVLEVLAGYLLPAKHLCGKLSARYARDWNFGPTEADHLTVGEVAGHCAKLWGGNARVEAARTNFQRKTGTLRLDASYAHETLCWTPRWCPDETLHHTLEWFRAWHADSSRMRALTLAQIDDYNTATT